MFQAFQFITVFKPSDNILVKGFVAKQYKASTVRTSFNRAKDGQKVAQSGFKQHRSEFKLSLNNVRYYNLQFSFMFDQQKVHR